MPPILCGVADWIAIAPVSGLTRVERGGADRFYHNSLPNGDFSLPSVFASGKPRQADYGSVFLLVCPRYLLEPEEAVRRFYRITDRDGL